jgi:hypothetical protein
MSALHKRLAVDPRLAAMSDMTAATLPAQEGAPFGRERGPPFNERRKRRD